MLDPARKYAEDYVLIPEMTLDLIIGLYGPGNGR